ncbi:MAG: lysine transporter LysE [Hyphomicrobiales bacterium]|nr:MAG: lysine transporter LysE [Hyphomicrobiales bacterium]
MGYDFLITAMIVVLVPGTGVLYTLACGLARGSMASVAAAFGCTLGILPHIAAAVFGLAALLHASALAFQAVKFAGVAYLLYMAWSALKGGGPLAIDDKVEARSAVRIAVTGFLINILNPKLSMFFLAFLPQFIAADAASPIADMLYLGAVFMAMTFVVFVGYGFAAAAVRDHVITRPRVMRWFGRSVAAAFVALGAKLAFAER